MRYLLFSLCVLMIGCKSEYKLLKPAATDAACVEKFRPKHLGTSWYTTGIDTYGGHYSGLLFMKKLSDDSYRLVFTSELGAKFFDFEFTKGDFKVHDIIPQMDKKAVVNTLRKDFELVLGLPFQGKLDSWKTDRENFFGVRQKKEAVYFITDSECASLQRLELASKRKRKVTVKLEGARRELPDSINIHHHLFKMDITLKKLVKE